MKAVILANGLFPVHPEPKKTLDNADNIVCTDGAIQHTAKLKKDPVAIVGDFDSTPEALMEKYKHLVFMDTDQETNDLTKSVYWCKNNGFTEVDIVGATGIREDHTLGNISLLVTYNKLLKARMITDFGIFIHLAQTTNIPCFPGQGISVFSLSSDTSIQSENLKFPLDGIKLSSWWKGTLNIAQDDNFKLIVENNTDIIVFLKHIDQD
jgi:thiamine pyrophosphokinase